MEYLNFFEDLLGRCCTMLGLDGAGVLSANSSVKTASVVNEDFAVTRILCFLTTALTIPHARLKPSKDKSGKLLATHGGSSVR